ncbi:MAG: GNAT family N-acetyltransferase [Elusimicrobia bacterium]|nr:GNAT family N-acetyltransferase [Elusimicrobiota bacterium]
MNHTLIEYRMMQSGEDAEVFALVERTFREFVGSDYSQEGVDTFFRTMTPEFIREHKNHFIMVAKNGSKIVGMINIRSYSHICLFFVDRAWHRKGIGRTLLDKTLEHCRINAPAVTKITANASPYSVPIYEKLGFLRMSSEELIHQGMRYNPMAKELN